MTKSILISIKTEFVNQISTGEKIYEYRRAFSNFGDQTIEKRVIIYSSKIDKAIVGEFTIDKIISTNIDDLIIKTNIQPEQEIFFRKYFHGKEICHAIKIKDFKRYSKPISLHQLKIIDPKFVAPQNYRFLDKNHPIYKKISQLK